MYPSMTRRPRLINPGGQMGGGTPPAAASTLKTGLISFWEFENTSWTDAVVATGNDLSQSASPTSGSSAPTKVGNYLNLVAASSQFLSHADTASLQVSGTDFSIAAWVYIDNFDGHIVAKSTTGFPQQGYALATRFTTNFRFTFFVNANGESGLIDADTFGNVTTGAWNYVVSTYTLSTKVLRISVNAGAQDASAPMSNVVSSDTAIFYIGTDAAVSAFHDGRIDQLGFWKKVLTTAEITQLYAGGSGLSYAAM